MDPKSNAVVQIAGLIEINDEIVEKFDLFCAPHKDAVIDPVALEINKRTLQEIQSFPPLSQAIVKLKNVLGKYVSRYDKNDKFVAAGYNVGFDREMLYSAFKNIGDNYGFGCWCFSVARDVCTLVSDAIIELDLRLPNYQLGTVCSYYGIPIEAHNALGDIQATRTLYHTLNSLIVGCMASYAP